LLGRADGEADGVRDELRHALVQQLGSLDAVLVLDETGFPKKGRHSAGVARQYSGTLGKIDNCPVGVLLGYASPLGHTWRDRELYGPQEWTNDRERCRQAGIPAARRFATKPQLAQQMLARASAAGVPARGLTGDRVYGAAHRLRRWLEARPQADVVAVSGQEYVGVDGRQRQVKTIRAALPAAGWTRRSAGAGTKGPRWYDWRWPPLAEPLQPDWRRRLLGRRRLERLCAAGNHVGRGGPGGRAPLDH
jgi:SRSO17 transposase